MFKSNLKAKEYENFENIIVIRGDGIEYWSARELSKILEYRNWENFVKVIDKAMLACKNSGYEIIDHFPEVRKTINIKQMKLTMKLELMRILKK